MADTSSLVSLAVGGVLEEAHQVVEIMIPAEVEAELADMAQYADVHGVGAQTVQHHLAAGKIAVQAVADSTRVDHLCTTHPLIDRGEAACVVLAEEQELDTLLCDDFKAFPTLLNLTDRYLFLSVYVLARLVHENLLSRSDAEQRFQQIAAARSWLGAAIFNYARRYL